MHQNFYQFPIESPPAKTCVSPPHKCFCWRRSNIKPIKICTFRILELDRKKDQERPYLNHLGLERGLYKTKDDHQALCQLTVNPRQM